ncbi:hypothetical protein ACFL3C_05190 [Patescibacteria group bacterium]
MKQILFIIYFIGSVFTNQGAYELPSGFEVINTWEENGVLSIVDTNGNGVDIYIEGVDSSDVDINWTSGNDNSIYPVDTIEVIPKQGFLLKAFFLKDDYSKEHGAFKEEIIKMMRSTARGGSHEKAWTDCVRTFVYHFGRGEG